MFSPLSSPATDRRRGRFVPRGAAGWRCAALLIAWIACGWADADELEATRIFEIPAYDQIALKDKTVIKVSPDPFPNGRMPENPQPNDVLIVRLIDRPTEEFKVHWRDIVEYKRFARLVMDEAEGLVAKGNLAEAYPYFEYLERNHASFPNLKASIEQYFYEDAKDCQRRKKYTDALVVLDELFRRNPGFPGLDRAWGAASDKIIEGLVAKKDYLGARQRLFSLQSRFPDEAVGQKWQLDFLSQSASFVAEAETAIGAKQYDVARERVFAALERWPRDESARRLAVDLFTRSPALMVGVTQSLPAKLRDGNTDWPSRRASRLLGKSLMELTGFDAEGGMYRCAVGEFSVEELGLELQIRLRPNITQADGAPFNGYDLSQFVIHATQAEPESALAQLLDHVNVRQVFNVDLRLVRPHVRPDALLSRPIAVTKPGKDDWQTDPLAPYRIEERSAARARYVAHSKARLQSATGPVEIYEQFYPSGDLALGALQRGEILIVDRLNPWDVAPTRKLEGVVVEPYAVPTVHVLIPNLKHPLLARRLFRRALVYGINRDAILQVQLLRGGELAETRVTSGPFPFGYAYNDRVEIRPYEPQIAMTLAQIATRELAAQGAPAPPAAPAGAQAKVGSDGAGGDGAGNDGAGNDGASADDAPVADPKGVAAPQQQPPLRLAHPPNEVARLACRAIQRQLKLLDIDIELVELSNQSTAEAVQKYDLVYAELTLEEPIVDARRLFGEGGLATGSSPHLDDAVMRLESDIEWKSAREHLHEIHQIIADDVAVIPLWQMSEYYAYRNTIEGLPPRSVVLYQDVEQWKVKPYLPPEKP